MLNYLNFLKIRCEKLLLFSSNIIYHVSSKKINNNHNAFLVFAYNNIDSSIIKQMKIITKLNLH